MPRVSVIVPTYNRAAYVVRAVESVLAQTVKDFEIIVVDDGSTDNTKDVLGQYQDKIRYIYQENKGPSAARNSGVLNARGEYIAFLDSDDRWLPDMLSAQLREFERDGGVGFVYTSMAIADENNKLTGETKPAKPVYDIPDFFIDEGRIPMTVMAKKELFDKFGLFSSELAVAEDEELWLRFLRHTKAAYIHEPLAICVRHDKNLSSNMIEYYKGLIGIFKKYSSSLSNNSQKTSWISKQYYLLGREHYKEKEYSKAAGPFFKSIVSNPAVGLMFKKDEGLKNNFCRLFLKPYFFVFCSLTLTLLSLFRREKNGQYSLL